MYETIPAPRRGGGIFAALGQLLVVMLVIALSIGGTLYALHAGPFGTPAEAPVTKVDLTPTVLHAVHSANQLVTAETQVDQIVSATASSRLPGSDEKVIYFAVYNIKAGVDLAQIKDSDITVNGDTVRIVLPPTHIISQSLDAQKSYVLSHSLGITAQIGGVSQGLMDTVLRTAEEKARTATLSDDTLLKAARENATADLTRILNASGITNVVFVDAATATTTAQTAASVTVTTSRTTSPAARTAVALTPTPRR